MKDLLLYVAQNLVDEPDKVVVTETETESEINFTLNVASGDMGKVIGRQGKIAREIRILMRSAAQKRGKRVNVDITN